MMTPILKPHPQRGMALVIVLGMLVLVVILTVAFVSSVTVELQSSKKYATGSDARALADSAVSLVISQIQDATANPRLAWASQPGMIRTYDDNGQPVSAFKLYSSSQPRVAGAFHAIQQLSTEIPAGWASRPSVYTDLNKPVTVDNKDHYPIIPPEAVAKDVSSGTPLSGNATIEGCFIDSSAPAVQLTSNQTNLVPMPVQWAYILKNGEIAHVDPSTSKISGATTANPITGRIAFWTDDETCKVNINTASEGTFWDRPWAAAKRPTSATKVDGGYERNLSVTVPVQNEFQRYPGHPAMTSLSVVFPKFASSLNSTETLYDVIPRVARGGSLQGTVTVNHTSSPIISDGDRLFSSVDEFMFSAIQVSGNNNRKLNSYESTAGSELNTEDIEKARFFITANSKAPEVNLFNKPRITLWPLQANTTDVSKPEQAVYRNSKDKLIAFCSTIGGVPYYFQRYNTYTSPTQNPIPSSQSPTMDWDLIPRNQQLYAYLQYLTGRPIPGLGGSLVSKYPFTRDQILTQMFDLVRSMVNTFSTGENPNYFYSPFSKAGMIAGQGQVVPLNGPNGTKGFGRFPTVTEAALILYTKSPLTISGPVPANGTISWGNQTKSLPSGMLNDYELPEGNTSIRLTGIQYILDHESLKPRAFGAVLILEPFNPTPGAPPWTASVRYAIRGLDTLNLGFPSGTIVNKVNSIESMYNATATTGLETNLQQPPRQPKVLGATDPGDPDPQYYPFASTFEATGTTFNFSGGTIAIDIYSGRDGPLDPSDLVQTVNMTFPPVNGLPLPQTAKKSVSGNATTGNTTVTVYNASHIKFSDYNNRLSYLRNPAILGRWGIAESDQHSPLPLVCASSSSNSTGDFRDLGDVVRSVEARVGGVTRGDYRFIAALRNVPSDYYAGHGTSGDPVLGGNLYFGTTSTGRLVHSLTLDNMPGATDKSGSSGFYLGSGSPGDPRGKLVAEANYIDRNRGEAPAGTGNFYRDSTRPVAPRGLNGALMVNGAPGDWDNGPGVTSDGPYVNMPDQANVRNATGGTDNLYYTKGAGIGSNIEESGTSFSPNRQISSAVAFGSLPTGIDPLNPSDPSRNRPWQTLLFGKHPAAGSAHPGFGLPLGAPPYSSPPDHAFLDFFTMPIVEPYPISEPFSTSGKINMNYQIVPFTYLTRNTGIRAVMKATNIMAIPTDQGHSYKYEPKLPPDFRYTINVDENTGTLKGFQNRFQSGDIFRSASEICDISLVPQYLVNTKPPTPAPGSPTYANMASWWNAYKLTGDNVREQPYGHIYPRLTTKSNTYMVHVQAQSIQKVPGTPPDEFIDGKDQITGEYRGSFLIERYLDPNSDSLVKADGTPANELDPDGMVGPYKFRVLSSKQFAP